MNKNYRTKVMNAKIVHLMTMILEKKRKQYFNKTIKKISLIPCVAMATF